MAPTQRNDWAADKPQVLHITQQSQDSEQDKMASTPSSPSSPPSSTGQLEETPAAEEEVLLTPALPQTPAMDSITSTNQIHPQTAPGTPRHSSTLSVSQLEFKEEGDSKLNQSPAKTRYQTSSSSLLHTVHYTVFVVLIYTCCLCHNLLCYVLHRGPWKSTPAADDNKVTLTLEPSDTNLSLT